MCKNVTAMRRIIDDAKNDCETVYAVIERNRDNRDELVGLVEVFNGILAILYDVNDEGEKSYESHTANFGGNPYALMKQLHLTRGIHRLVAC